MSEAFRERSCILSPTYKIEQRQGHWKWRLLMINYSAKHLITLKFNCLNSRRIYTCIKQNAGQSPGEHSQMGVYLESLGGLFPIYIPHNWDVSTTKHVIFDEERRKLVRKVSKNLEVEERLGKLSCRVQTPLPQRVAGEQQRTEKEGPDAPSIHEEWSLPEGTSCADEQPEQRIAGQSK